MQPRRNSRRFAAQTYLGDVRVKEAERAVAHTVRGHDPRHREMPASARTEPPVGVVLSH
jgi:hypothetical protein